MFDLLSVVPIIIPSDPVVRAELAEDFYTFGEWMLSGLILYCIFSGVNVTIKGIIRLIRYIMRKRKE